MRKAAVSIASNIAEGAARRTTRELVQFLYVASGSASELYTQLEIAKDAIASHATGAERLQTKVNSVSRMLRGLIKSLQTSE